MTLTGSCHCGATRFELDEAPESVTACTCSYCAKTGALWAYYAPQAVRLTIANESVYAPRVNQHHFCPVCGISTFGLSPTWSLDGTADFSKPKMAVNARLLDDFDLAQVRVEAIDGRNLW